PLHGNNFEAGSQLKFMTACRTARHPEGRRLDVSKSSPLPACFGPVAFFLVAAIVDELPEFAVADKIPRGKKFGNGTGSYSIFIIPTIGWEFFWFTDFGRPLSNRQKLIRWKILTKEWFERTGCRSGAVIGPLRRSLHQLHRQFPNQHR